jgi:outer membrane protein assembly factor BamB
MTLYVQSMGLPTAETTVRPSRFSQILGRTARYASTASVLVVASLLSACASWNKPSPKPLQAIAQPIAGAVQWEAGLGSSVSFPLRPNVRDDVVTLASDEGRVVSLDPSSGKERWRVELNQELSAGLGGDGRVLALVTKAGELLVINAQGGSILWRTPVGARILTAPVVAGGRVFLLGTDRSVWAFDAADGVQLWRVARPGEPLSLSSAGVLSVQGDTLLVGQGKYLAALDPSNGQVLWEAPMAKSRGTNELERLVDLVGPSARVGSVHCARAFQSAVSCVNGLKGVVLWTKNIGGLEPIAADSERVIGADGSSRISAWKFATGELVWSDEKLIHRELSAPLLKGDTVVFGDMDGTAHILSAKDGQALLRLSTDGGAIRVPPVAAAGLTVVVTSKGRVFGLRY